MSEMQDRVKLVLRTFRSATTEIQAREVLKAMREPTAEMLYFGVGNKDARQTWNLMMDRALT